MNVLDLDQVLTLAGPNLWARVPVLEVHYQGSQAAAREVAATAVRLQQAAGCQLSFFAVSSRFLAVEYEVEGLGRRALEAALTLTLATLSGEPAEETSAIAPLRRLADDVVMGANTRALVEAARRRHIPVRRLDHGSLLQLGHGIHQRRLCGAFTDRTSSIAETVSWDKNLAKSLLAAVGVPVPEGHLALSAQAACEIARELGGPVVVKPESANHGRAVFIGLSGPGEIRDAFEVAAREGSTPNVVVERYIPGAEHRVLVIDGRAVAASRSDPLYVTGDGEQTVAQLVAEVNADPRRGPGAASPLDPVAFDDTTLATLAQQELEPDSVPARGAPVLVRRNGNHSANVTNSMHPANRELCALAAATVGLDVAGVDLIAQDLSRPLREQGGAILEVNAMPGLMMHLHPGEGPPVPVDDMIVESLFPCGATGRISIVAVNSEAPEAALLVGRALESCGLSTGIACPEGVFAMGEKLRPASASLTRDGTDLLLHPKIEVAVLATPDAAILGGGLSFDYCHAAVFDHDPRRNPTPAKCVLLETLLPEGAIVHSPDPHALGRAVLDALCLAPL